MRDFKTYQIEISQEVCIGCGQCVDDCPEMNISMVKIDQGNKACVTRPTCIKCAHCVAICPVSAISIPSFDQIEAVTSIENLHAVPAITNEQLLQTIRFKRSMRKFKSAPVPEQIIAELLEIGRWTPTAKNAQDVEFVVIRDELSALEEKAVCFFRRLLSLVRLFNRSARGVEIDEHFFFKGAPLAIVILSKDKVSASLAAANMSLLAETHGLGILYSGFFTVAANLLPSLKKRLGVGRKKVVTTLVIGYPAVHYRRSTQKKEAVVRYL